MRRLWAIVVRSMNAACLPITGVPIVAIPWASIRRIKSARLPPSGRARQGQFPQGIRHVLIDAVITA